MTVVEKATIGSSVTFVALVIVVIIALHCVLRKLKKRIWFLGYREPRLDQMDERQRRHLHPAFQWRYEKERELERIMVPFRFDDRKVEFEN